MLPPLSWEQWRRDSFAARLNAGLLAKRGAHGSSLASDEWSLARLATVRRGEFLQHSVASSGRIETRP
jgi:hypothetical protein